ncbi:MAG: ATP synthase F0 subunit B [Lachnospiraceae bacterium]|nr:ATP synthase F0 subunit B [Lachnospiraceae bacterium]
MLSFDWFNFVCMIINLLILYFLMKKFLFGRVNRILDERKKEIENGFLEVEEKKKEAEKAEEEYRTHLAELTFEGEKKKKEEDLRAAVEYNRLISEANEKAGDIIKKARDTARYETRRAVVEQEKEMRSLILSAASKIAGSKGTANDNELYDRFIENTVHTDGGNK